MTFNDKYDINKEDGNLFEFRSKQEEYEHEAKILMFKFLSEIEKLIDTKKLLKKELASAIGTSASYITQLYNGDKLINLLTLAKLQDVYDIEFEVKAVSNKSYVSLNQPFMISSINIPAISNKYPKAEASGYNNDLTFVSGDNYHKKVS